MKKYEDNRISFLYPEGFKLIRAKSKWGQYDLAKKKDTLIIINIISGELDTEERIIWSRPPNDIKGLAKMEYFKSVNIGEKKGIGHVATLYDHSHKFWGKIYRYLFPNPTKGGIYIEISDREDFTIDRYRELIESIKVKETDNPN
jgi:hypothetical protein